MHAGFEPALQGLMGTGPPLKARRAGGRYDLTHCNKCVIYLHVWVCDWGQSHDRGKQWCSLMQTKGGLAAWQLSIAVLAAFLVVVGFLVWANLIATPVYHDGSPDYPVWQILNYFMAVAAVIILVKGFLMRRAHAHEDGACS